MVIKTNSDKRKEVYRVAEAHGMKVALVHHDGNLADIWCPRCGWPAHHRETRIDRYLREPYPCVPCTYFVRNGEPHPGFPEWGDRVGEEGRDQLRTIHLAGSGQSYGR